MKKQLLLMASIILLLSFVASGWAQEVQDYPVMRPDPATREQWYQEWLNAPKAYVDPQIAQTLDWGPRPMLLDKITYTPSERHQASCGNCWVWAGTGLLEILHNVEHGANDRLSIQFFNSCFNATDFPGPPVGYYACGGGNLGTFVAFYNQRVLVPWSNTNAFFQDAAGGSAPHVACGSIGGTPDYNGNAGAFIAATIPTWGVARATAIANIKNILAQNKGVQFNYWLATGAHWSSFQTFFGTGSETQIWDPDQSFCGATEDSGTGGHAVVIVGYNDDSADPNQHYWIVLNSWGTGWSNNRPNGLFRMKMNMDYDCTTYDSGNSVYYYSRQFQTINTQYDPFYDYNSLYMAAKGASTNNIWFRKKNSVETWGSWTQLDGTTSHTPSMANFNSRLYMAVKGVVTPKIWIRSMNYQGVWTSWTEIPGGSTSAGPTLVTYRNRLCVFAKGASTNLLWYNSMGTNGVWSGWEQVAGSYSIDSPAVVVMNDQLVMYQVDGYGQIWWKIMSNDGTWSGWWSFTPDWDLRTDAGISATVFNNSVVLVAKGLNGTPFANTISYISSGTGSATSYYPWAQIPGGTTTSRPQVAWGPTPGQFYVTVKGSMTGQMWENYYTSGSGLWAGWTRSDGGSTHAPSVNTYYFGNYY